MGSNNLSLKDIFNTGSESNLNDVNYDGFTVSKFTIPSASFMYEKNISSILQQCKKLLEIENTTASHLIKYKQVWIEVANNTNLSIEQKSKIQDNTKLTENRASENEQGGHNLVPACPDETTQDNVSSCPEIVDDPTTLYIVKETFNSVSLEEWLKDREYNRLYKSQVLHIIHSVVEAIKFLIDNGISKTDGIKVQDILVISQDQFSQSILPSIKLTNLDFEKVLVALSHGDVPVLKVDSSENLLHSSAQLFLQLLKRTLMNSGNSASSDEITTTANLFPEEDKIIKEMLTSVDNRGVTNVLEKLKTLSDQHSSTVTMNLSEPCNCFVGRDQEIVQLLTIVTNKGSSKSIVSIEGPSGVGKTELVLQTVQTVILQEKSCSIFYIDASYPDTFTTNILHLAAHSVIQVATKDYIGNPKLLADIFREILYSCENNNFILIFDNANAVHVELLDLLQVFKDTPTSKEHFQHLIIIREDIWTSNSILEECHRISLQYKDDDYKELFRNAMSNHSQEQNVDNVCSNEPNLNTLLSIHSNSSIAATKLIVALIKTPIDGILEDEKLQFLIQQFKTNLETHSEIKNDNVTHAFSDILPYFTCLSNLTQIVSPTDKQLLVEMLNIFQFMDENFGMDIKILFKILNQHETVKNNPNLEECIQSLLKILCQRSLIMFRDTIVFLSSWMQQALKASMIIFSKSDQSIDIASSSKSLIASIQAQLLLKEDQNPCWNFIHHVTKIWSEVTRTVPSLAKDFDTIPHQIALIAKRLSKFEHVTGFLKQCCEIFATVYGPVDVCVLKLKYLVAKESLLRKSKINEAFTIFKMITEQGRTEPRDCLMLRLESYIELGKIHITRQHYDKAISCCQQVQVFAVQKIALLELDSEPTVLKARVVHGQAHVLQNNGVEGKKILLQIIPLLEKYSGPDKANMNMVLLQAKFYLATLLRKSGDLINALMIQTKVLEERERIHGLRHPDTWESKQEMAKLFSSYDNQEKALSMLKEVLEIQEEILGAPSNRQSLATMNAIAEIETKIGNFDDALELYEAIDLIEQQVLEENDEMRINSQLNQADVLIALGQYKEAIDIFDLVYALRSSTGDATGVINGAISETILNKREKTERSMESVGNYWLKLTPENLDNPEDLGTLAKKHEVAMELSENLDYHGALRFLREVLEDSVQLEDTNRFLLNVKADYARCLGLVGKFNESFSVYKEIIPLMDATFGETDELTMLCKDTMGQVFLFSGNQFLKRRMSNLKWFLL